MDQEGNLATAQAATASKGRPQWLLHYQAQMWRFLMAIGMFLHRLASPRPSKPSFVRVIPTTISPSKGQVSISFYTPKDYNKRKALGKAKFPLVVNFHGGGFTLGASTDDARWSNTVVQEVNAVVASVDYRLAPEHAFPTAVEDGVDAIIYLAKNAEEFWVDKEKIAVSGFSSGGNMAFTVPLRLQEELYPEIDAGSRTDLGPVKAGGLDGQNAKQVVNMLQQVRIAAICAWYPSTDYTNTREQRRATNIRKDQELSQVFTQLFDESYLQPPTMNMSNPYLSPGVASRHLLSNLPDNIILYTCEWDMLLAEGQRMKARLEDLGKDVRYTMVEEVPHGWDKAPNPFRQQPNVKKHYLEACSELKRILNPATENSRKSMSMGRFSVGGRRLSMNPRRSSVEAGPSSRPGL